LEHGPKHVSVVDPGDDSSKREVRRIFGAFESLDVVLEDLAVDDGALVRLLLELGDEERDQGHPLRNIPELVSSVKKRCIIVV
jgi:hypothetical protein